MSSGFCCAHRSSAGKGFVSSDASNLRGDQVTRRHSSVIAFKRQNSCQGVSVQKDRRPIIRLTTETHVSISNLNSRLCAK